MSRPEINLYIGPGLIYALNEVAADNGLDKIVPFGQPAGPNARITLSPEFRKWCTTINYANEPANVYAMMPLHEFKKFHKLGHLPDYKRTDTIGNILASGAEHDQAALLEVQPRLKYIHKVLELFFDGEITQTAEDKGE